MSSSLSCSSSLSSTASDGFPMSANDLDVIGINPQLLVLSDETDVLNTQINRGYGFQQAIYDHKMQTKDEMGKMAKKMGELRVSLAKKDQIMRTNTEARVAEVLKNAEPYLSSGQAPHAERQDMMAATIRILSTVKGISSAMEKTKDLSANVLKHHEMLNRIEEKQRDAIARFEEATRVENLTHDVAPEDALYELVHLPKLLLAFSLNPDFDPIYRSNFKNLEQRVAALVAQIRFNNAANEQIEIPSSLSSMSNGEIDVASLVDQQEHPLDSLKVKTPESVY